MCVTGRLLICLYLSKPDMLLCVFVCVCVCVWYQTGVHMVFEWVGINTGHVSQHSASVLSAHSQHSHMVQREHVYVLSK